MSDKKKHRRRKPLSDHEIERRKKLREKRIQRKRQEKRTFLIKAIVIAALIVLGFSVGIVIDLLCDYNALIIYLSIISIIGTTITDRCGLRKLIFKYYPDKFIFSDYLKKDYHHRSLFMELARTVCYYSLCLMFACKSLSLIWGVCCIISMIVGYLYIIFDRNNEYTFDKFSKYSDTSMFLIFAGCFGLAISDYSNLNSVPLLEIVLGTAVITMLYAVFGKNDKKVEQTISVAVFSAVDINAAIAVINFAFKLKNIKTK